MFIIEYGSNIKPYTLKLLQYQLDYGLLYEAYTSDCQSCSPRTAGIWLPALPELWIYFGDLTWIVMGSRYGSKAPDETSEEEKMLCDMF